MSPSSPATPRRSRRLLAAAACLLVVPPLVLAAPGLASAATTTDRADAAAGWLGRQLSAHDHVIEGDFGANYGLTADVVLALDSAGVGQAAASGATTALKAHVLDYTGGGDPTELYAGSFAKLINVAVAQRVNPRAFGRTARQDLVGHLRYLECGNGRRPACPAADKGRFSDLSQYGDFSNTITQSLALLGLERATTAGPSVASVVYLRKQQCANGAFPLEISTAGCNPSVDATAFAVQALNRAGGQKARAAAARGGGWLKRAQHHDGSFTGNGTRNTNTTGLAAQALRAVGRDRAADKAVGFVLSLQLRCGAKPANRGKIRYDKANSGLASLATAQAVPALARVGLADITSKGARRALPTLAC
ncbi:MAG: prenyltransferase/squalene oxidase repeat-containing protein [Actinomycetes bacterium]